MLAFRRPHLRLDGLEILLAAGRPLRLHRARGLRLRCTGGRAWITAAGLFEDVVLQAGEIWEVPGDGLVLVEGLGRATVALHGPQAQAMSPST